MPDKFYRLPEIVGTDAGQFDVTPQYLREIAEAQHGCFTKKRFSDACLASYPRFTKGPGGRWGIFESQLDAYWSRLQAKNEVVIEAQERFRARGRR